MQNTQAPHTTREVQAVSPPKHVTHRRNKTNDHGHWGTHEFLQVLPVFPIEAPISLPDPAPAWVMPRPGGKENDGIVSLNLRAAIQFVGGIICSIIGEYGDRASEEWVDRWRGREKGNNDGPCERVTEPAVRYRGGIRRNYSSQHPRGTCNSQARQL